MTQTTLPNSTETLSNPVREYIPHPSSPWLYYDGLAQIFPLSNRYFVYVPDAEGTVDIDDLEIQPFRHPTRANKVVAAPGHNMQWAVLHMICFLSARGEEPDWRLREREVANESSEVTLARDRSNPWRQTPGVESLGDVLLRTTQLIAELELNYQAINVLLIMPESIAKILCGTLGGIAPQDTHDFQVPASTIFPLPFSENRCLVREWLVKNQYGMLSIPWHPLNWFRHGQGWLRRSYLMLTSLRTHARLFWHDWWSVRQNVTERRTDSLAVASGGTKTPRIHPVFFTCRSHFRYLLPAVTSFARFPQYMGTFYIYTDRRDPLTDDQMQLLVQLNVAIEFYQRDRTTGWGGCSLLNQLEFLSEVGARHKPHDYFAKVDSDVLLVNDNVLKAVIDSNSDLFGHPCVNSHNPGQPYIYAQGGCYFLRCNTASRLFHQRMMPVIWEGGRRAAIPYPHCPEDAGTFNAISRLTDNIVLREFYLPTYQIGSQVNTWPHWASIIHFERIWYGDLRDRMGEFLRRVQCDDSL